MERKREELILFDEFVGNWSSIPSAEWNRNQQSIVDANVVHMRRSSLRSQSLYFLSCLSIYFYSEMEKKNEIVYFSWPALRFVCEELLSISELAFQFWNYLSSMKSRRGRRERRRRGTDLQFSRSRTAIPSKSLRTLDFFHFCSHLLLRCRWWTSRVFRAMQLPCSMHARCSGKRMHSQRLDALETQ